MLLGIGAAVLLAFVWIVALTFGENEKENADTATTRQSPTFTTSPPPRSTQTASQTLRAWMSGAAEPVGNVGDALIAIGGGLERLDFPTVRAHCPDLRAASDQLERELPAPDAAVTAALQDGIDNFRSLSQLCVNASLDMSPTEIQQMRSYLDLGGSRMCDAYELMGLNTGCRG